MSGLLSEKLYKELFTELAWVKQAVSELSAALAVESYSISLLRNRVEPEEAAALEKVIFSMQSRLVVCLLGKCVLW